VPERTPTSIWSAPSTASPTCSSARGIHPPAGVHPWTTKYRAWLTTAAFPRPSGRVVLREYLLAVDQATDRLGRLEAKLAELAKTCTQAPLITALQALRGVALITATTLAAEVGDLRRFPRARALMGYSGLVSREDSSGPKHRQGAITKAGNSHLRRVLIEAAWHYQHQPGVGKALGARQQGQRY
jgi:transposase